MKLCGVAGPKCPDGDSKQRMHTRLSVEALTHPGKARLFPPISHSGIHPDSHSGLLDSSPPLLHPLHISKAKSIPLDTKDPETQEAPIPIRFKPR